MQGAAPRLSRPPSTSPRPFPEPASRRRGVRLALRLRRGGADVPPPLLGTVEGWARRAHVPRACCQVPARRRQDADDARLKVGLGRALLGRRAPPARRGPPTLAHRPPRPRGARPAAGTLSSLRTIAAEEGAAALLKGIGPRVGWISIGGSLISRDEPR